MCNQLIYSCECNLVVSKNFWAQFAPPCFISAKVLRTRLTRVLTLSDPGYFRQLTIRGGGGFKSPPPTISKTIASIFTISYMWILLGVLGMIQLEFFKNSRF